LISEYKKNILLDCFLLKDKYFAFQSFDFYRKKFSSKMRSMLYYYSLTCLQQRLMGIL
jgi:hypothetical protein